MYQSWVKFCDSKENIEKAKQIMNRSYGYQNDNIEDIMLRGWVSEENPCEAGDFEIDTCMLSDFPLHLQAKMISEFITDEYKYSWGVDYEITKLIYKLWYKYMLDSNRNPIRYKDHNKSNEYHKLIFESLYTLKYQLKEMKDLDYEMIGKLREKYPNKGRYYNWHLLGCLPLLGETGLQILRSVCQLHYNDADELLLFGLYQYNPKEFYPELKKILLYWYENQNIEYSISTGMLFRFKRIVKKYKKYGIDMVHDPDLSNIFQIEVVQEILGEYYQSDNE